MDEETKMLLRKNLEISKENNKLLKKVRRDALWGNIFKIIWFLVIIGVPVALWYYVIEPSLASVQMGIGGAQNALFDTPFIGQLIEAYFEGQGIENPIETETSP